MRELFASKPVDAAAIARGRPTISDSTRARRERDEQRDFGRAPSMQAEQPKGRMLREWRGIESTADGERTSQVLKVEAPAGRRLALARP